MEPKAAQVVGKPTPDGGTGLSWWCGLEDPGPALKCRRLRCLQGKKVGWTSPVKSTSGHPWVASAPSFSCHWSSLSSATTVSSKGAQSGGKQFALLSSPALLAPSSPCPEIGWRFLGPELHCRVRHSPFLSWRQNSRNPFPFLFPLSGTVLGRQSPYPRSRSSVVFHWRRRNL